MKSHIVLLFILVSLTGCSGYDLNSLPINANNMAEVGELIKTASETKEAIYYDAVKNRDEAYKDMYSKQGFKLSWNMSEQKINGVSVFIPLPEVSYKAPPTFQQPLPSGPSKHPVWGVVDTGLHIARDLTIGWLAYDGLKTIWQRSAPQYNGPYAPVSNSYNPTTSTSSTVIP